MNKIKKKKIICITGATASGKSALAEKIAKEKNGVIISADSRQVYKNIPIFSGISKSEKANFLVGILNEWEEYSASEFVKRAEKKMNEIWNTGKIPVVVGGTSFYFKSLLYENFIPQVPQNKKLRKKLADKNANQLMEILKNLDYERARNIDSKNKPRIIRAIEIAKKLGKVPEVEDKIKENLDIDFFWVHIDKNLQKEKIAKNFKNRMELGFFKEAQNLKIILENFYTKEVEKTKHSHAVFSTIKKFLFKKKYKISQEKIINKKVSEKFYNLGLAYKHIFKFWAEEITNEKFIELGILEEQKYAKRQNTYLKKFYIELPNSVNKKEIK